MPFEPDSDELSPADQWQDRALCRKRIPKPSSLRRWLHPGGQEDLPRLRGAARVLDYALAHDERFGIWGGLSERERRRLKRGII